MLEEAGTPMVPDEPYEPAKSLPPIQVKVAVGES
jgi:hypothetical protein